MPCSLRVVSVQAQQPRRRCFMTNIRRSRVMTLLCGALIASLTVGSANAGRLVIDAAGNLFVPRGSSILRFAPDGAQSTFATGLKNPAGISFDKGGNLFVTDTESRAIYKFSPDG